METPFCMQAGANQTAFRVPFHGAGGCGSRQRSSPKGAAANGTPRYAVTPLVVTPSIAPDSTRTGLATAVAASRHEMTAMLTLRQEFATDALPFSTQFPRTQMNVR